MGNLKIKRDTSADLFTAAMKAARDAGELARLDNITDYSLPEWRDDVVEITNYGFDVLFVANYGGSEGIYIDGYINGAVDNSGTTKRLRIGVIKTLATSLDAMKIMGEACGILTHFASKYINANLDRYEPDR